MTLSERRRLMREYLAVGMSERSAYRLLSAYPVDERDPDKGPVRVARGEGFEYGDVVRPGAGVGS
ncbi:MAG: hypothetical protein H0W72_02885 [Planctomycetes bacterium]|nr:hypothetical protein [Planctomycetota bacterium]